jgi:hypothetical protein
MPGENILPASEYPDDFEIVSIPFFHAMDATAAFTIPLMYADVDLAVDSIVIGVSVLEAAKNAEVVHATTVQATTGFLALQTAAVSTASAGTTVCTVNTSNNIVPAGNWIFLKFDAATTAVHGCVQLRFRTRLK